VNSILIVEDEMALREAFVTVFQVHGFKVNEAANGQEAIEILKQSKPRIILLDLLMPIMGGIEFLEHGNVKKTCPSTDILVFSNLSDAETISKIKSLGATDFLLKSSVTPQGLIDKVNEILGKKSN